MYLYFLDSTKSDDQVSLYFFIAFLSLGIIIGITFLGILLVGCRRLIHGKPANTGQANPRPAEPGAAGDPSSLGGHQKSTSSRLPVISAVYDEPSEVRVVESTMPYEIVDPKTWTRSDGGYELPRQNHIGQNEVRYENCLFNGYTELNQIKDKENHYAGLK